MSANVPDTWPPEELVFRLAVKREVWEKVPMGVVPAFGIFLENERVDDLEDQYGGVIEVEEPSTGKVWAVKVVIDDELRGLYSMALAKEEPVGVQDRPPLPANGEPF